VLLLLSACESGGKFIVFNNSSYPVYTAVDSGPQVTIPAGGMHSFEIDTKTQSLFSGEVKRTVPVFLKGETYSMEDAYHENLWTDNTTIIIYAGEVLQAYVNPNRACIKVTNNSSQTITEATIYKNAGVIPTPFAVITNILPGESKFQRVDYYTTSNQFFYQIELKTEDGNTYNYGDASTTMLLKDEQYPIVFTDPVK
jgi:hypothetical protein